MSVKHLRPVNGSTVMVPSSSKKVSEICFVDYAQCPVRDTCWVLDLGSSCDAQDSCIIDTQ